MNAPISTSRRTVVKSAAWALPAVTVVAATPAFAASQRVDLWVTARLPREARDGQRNGYNYYDGPRNLTFNYTVGNNGPDDMPAGALVTILLPFADAWGQPTIVAAESGRTAVFVDGGREKVNTSAGNPDMYRGTWTFRLTQPLPANRSFDLVFAVRLNDVHNTATNFYRARTVGEISVGATGKTETTLTNNRDFSDNYALFNDNAGTAGGSGD